jgi:hypothetical protein
MKAALTVFLSCMGLLSATGSALAHHSFDAEYDRSKTVLMKGTVTRLEWMNPHTRFYIDVKDATGKVTNWNFELASLNSLRRNGWTQFTLKIGDVVTASGYAALSGVPMANASSVRLADGTRLFAETNAPSVQQTPQP